MKTHSLFPFPLFSFLAVLGGLFLSCENSPQTASSLPIDAAPANLQEVSHLRVAAPFSSQQDVLYQGELQDRPISLSLTIKQDSLVSGEGTFMDGPELIQVTGQISRPLETQFALELSSENQPLGKFQAILQGGMSLAGEWTPHQESNQVQPMRWVPKEQVVKMPPPISTSGFVTIENRVIRMSSPDSACRITHEYPRFSGFASTELNRKINEWTAPRRMEIQRQLANCAVEASEINGAWEQHTQASYQIHLFTPKLMSLSLIRDVFEQQGSLPVSEQYASILNLNPHTGQAYAMEEIFTEGFQTELNARIEQWWEQRFMGDLELESDQIAVHQQFEFHPDLMIVRFDPNTVGEYVPKAIRIPFPYQDIAGWFRPGSPVQSFLPVTP
jgi:hypothetical protein